MNKPPQRPHGGVKKIETVYDGGLFSFTVEDVRLPNGVDTRMAFVRHPGSTGIVPLTDDGRVVMTRQYRHAVREHLLEVPAGTMDPGELPLDCARRELEEETGMLAGSLQPLGRIHILPSYSDEIIHLYLARNLTRTVQRLDRDEIIALEIHPLADLMEMIDDGRITDALTILCLQRTWLLRQGAAPGQA